MLAIGCILVSVCNNVLGASADSSRAQDSAQYFNDGTVCVPHEGPVFVYLKQGAIVVMQLLCCTESYAA